MTKEIKSKLAQFCNVCLENVVECKDVDTIYQVPLELQKQNFDQVVLKTLGLPFGQEPDLKDWNIFLKKYRNPKTKVEIAIVGKYISLQDSYKSISEAFIHAGAALETEVQLRWIYSGDITQQNIISKLDKIDGILIAPGFGDRGIEGKILVAQYARENNIPILGICLGMQIMIIEFARNVLKLDNANSVEFDTTTPHPVINLMEEQKNILDKGGTMRLGAWHCQLALQSKIYSIYNNKLISERHRHRYEFNNDYKHLYEKKGLIPTGINPETKLVEAIEIQDHPFYIGVQYHPEYKSTVSTPHPLFISFLKAASEKNNEITYNT